MAKSPRKRANYFSDLVERLVESKQLLVARENGQVFFYEDDGGLYRPISHLNSFLVNFFDEYTKRGLLAHDVREIAERLTWKKEIQCGRDSFNQDPCLINLKTGCSVWTQAYSWSTPPGSALLTKWKPSTLKIKMTFIVLRLSCSASPRWTETQINANCS